MNTLVVHYSIQYFHILVFAWILYEILEVKIGVFERAVLENFSILVPRQILSLRLPLSLNVLHSAMNGLF